MFDSSPRIVSIPLPAGTTLPSKANPSTVEPEVEIEISNPASAAAPPLPDNIFTPEISN